ncbi:hypothetical protein G3580_12285 [Nitrogeniibacter mangrovi]|uniref:Lipoprotein n=1 Tax=Nitrogeniibacter mangrovi TaxID=2016596 RepID=A0A6C1AZH8_9RHOO|nr:hypothetical protein [Nitrogeniibacter mangrovi]QID16139.1 hypothetical protein G3580_12285 [Nitrogeniibacter mangrovi]
MVMRMLRLGCLVAAAVSISACAANPDDGTEPELFPLDIGSIETVTVTRTGITAAAGKGMGIRCEKFSLSAAEAAAYFANAKRVLRRDYRSLVDWSPCYVRGQIQLTDGTRGTWSIHQYRGGVLQLDGRDDIYLYCPTCSAAGFDRPQD